MTPSPAALVDRAHRAMDRLAETAALLDHEAATPPPAPDVVARAEALLAWGCKRLGIAQPPLVWFDRSPPAGYFATQPRRIAVQRDLPQDAHPFVLMHELGHAWLSDRNIPQSERLADAVAHHLLTAWREHHGA